MNNEIIDNQIKDEVVDDSNNFEEVQVFQEVTPLKKEIRTDSYFDGSLIELIGWRVLAFLISVITLGIGATWAQCMLYSYQIKHTVYNGKRLKFEGTGGDLFVNVFKWTILSIITFGIYIIFIPIKKTKWVVSNIHFEDEQLITNESFFDGKTLQLFGVNLLCNTLNLISLGLLYPFTICYKLRWINRHTIINRKKLVFNGKSLSLFGKYILWFFLSIITLGIYGLWLPIRILKWQTKNTHIKTVGEIEEKSSITIIGLLIGLICILVSVLVIKIIVNQIIANKLFLNI